MILAGFPMKSIRDIVIPQIEKKYCIVSVVLKDLITEPNGSGI